jgi:hypothetical protein
VITWKVTDTAGIASTKIAVDGTNLVVCGPYGTKYDANYAGLLGSLAPGSHTYAITATDVNGLSNTSTSTFTVAGSTSGPAISSIVVAASAVTPVITCRVTDASGITSTTITVDGTPLTVYGPYGTKYAANYAGVLGALSAGVHTYVITATDVNGLSNTSTAAFTVASSAAIDAVVSTSVGDSVKADWLIDSNNAAAQSSNSANTVDTAFATY